MTICIPGKMIINWSDRINTTMYSIFPYPMITSKIPDISSQIGAVAIKDKE
jgi:hypothetical protein